MHKSEAVDTHNQEPQDSHLPSRQCTAIKKDGERCGARAVHGEDKCSLHGSRAADIRAKAVQASVQARQDKVARREEAKEAAKWTLTQWIAHRAAERADELAQAAVNRAIEGDTRALSIVLERVDGKVRDQLTVTAGDPFEMSQAELFKWLNEAPTEQPTLPDSPKSDD